MPDIVGVVAQPITEIVTWVFRTLERHISFVTKYHVIMENLHNEASSLESQRVDLKNQVDVAERKLEKPTAQVVQWLRETESILSHVENLSQQAQDDMRCLKGLCPNVCTRSQLSKQATKKVYTIKKLQEDGRNFTRISYPLSPPSIEVMQKDWVEDIESMVLIKTKVIEALHDESIRSIGVHGMGGSGKTTLLKSINNELEKTHLFKKVIMLTVSRNVDIKEIQDMVANRLGFSLMPETFKIRGIMLFKKLMEQEPILIILDDLWNELSLETIGITHGNRHSGCKIIVATRDRQVCTNMEIENIFVVERLSEREAWTLFQQKVGNVVTKPNIKHIAEEITKKCYGLPLAIATLGSSMKREEEIHQWRHILHVLENPYQSNIQDTMPEVMQSLKYSYDYLPGYNIKLCFLFCCLFPKDINILELRDYGIGEGFLDGNGSLENASDQLYHYLQILKNCSLLDSDEEGHVKLFDVVRYVALSIASMDGNEFLVNVVTQSRNWSEVHELHRYRIAFINGEGFEFPVPLECPRLRTLVIKNCGNIMIDENTFSNMHSLCVLHINGECRASPWVIPSLAYLKNLRTLHLINCDLSSTISELGGMGNLEILSLKYSKIGILPEEIGNLRNLKLLDLTYAELSAIAPNVFYRLSKLEELHALCEFHNWSKDVVSLVKMSHLEIQLGDWLFTCSSSSWDNLKQTTADYRSRDRIRLWNTSQHKNCPCLWLSKLSHVLKLESLNGLDNVVDLVDAGGAFKHLEVLQLQACNGIENMMSIGIEFKSAVQDSFQCLKKLKISDMENMKKIFHGPTPERFLGQLESLSCHQCPKLINIFSSNTLLSAQSLGRLEELYVEDCEELQEVFSNEWESVGVDEHPKCTSTVIPMLSGLSAITLHGLPKLTSIWKGNVPVGSLGNVHSLVVNHCHALKYIFTSSVAQIFQKLMDLQICNCDGMEKLVLLSDSNMVEEKTSSSSSSSKREAQMSTLTSEEASSPSTVVIFQNLQKLRIERCCKLKKLFSFRLAQGLKQLKQLEIWSCFQLEEIIGEEEATKDAEDHHHHHVDLLPQLESLSLHQLPNLICIYNQGTLPIVNCLLKQVHLSECHNIKDLFPFSIACGLLQLQVLSVRNCSSLEVIIGNNKEQARAEDHHGDLLPQLLSLELRDLPNVTCLYHQGSLPLLECGLLKRVHVEGCMKLKRLPLDPQCASNTSLKIIGEQKWFEALIWDEESFRSLFEALFVQLGGMMEDYTKITTSSHGQQPTDAVYHDDEEVDTPILNLKQNGSSDGQQPTDAVYHDDEEMNSELRHQLST